MMALGVGSVVVFRLERLEARTFVLFCFILVTVLYYCIVSLFCLILEE